MEFYPFQLSTVEKSLVFLKARNACYVANEMGLGKSLTAIETCNRLGSKKVLVICPAVVRLVWEKELQKWGHGDCRYTVFSYTTTANNIDTIKTAEFDTLILDEAHYVKNTKAQRTKAVLKHLWPKAKYRICLSGTPLLQSAADLWPIFSRILPEEFGDFDTFTSTYTKRKSTPWGVQYSGVKNAEKLSALIRNNFFIRYTKAQVLPELPPKIWTKIPLDKKYCVKLTKEEEVQYREYLKKLKESFQSGVACRTQPPKADATWRREQGVKKIKPIIEFAKELLDQDIPIILFTCHREVLKGIKEGLANYNPVVIEGDTKPSDRAKAVEDFQSGKTNLFLGNLRAAGVGITLIRSSTVLLAEPCYTPAEISQGVDRAHRIGTTNSVNVYYFIVQESIDEDVFEAVLDKVSDFHQVLA